MIFLIIPSWILSTEGPENVFGPGIAGIDILGSGSVTPLEKGISTALFIAAYLVPGWSVLGRALKNIFREGSSTSIS